MSNKDIKEFHNIGKEKKGLLMEKEKDKGRK